MVRVRQQTTALFVLLCALGCSRDDPTPKSPDLKENERTAAVRWLAADGELPNRARTVAAADQLAIRAGELGQSVEAVERLTLAASLRERIWRLEHRATDVREAIELLGNIERLAPQSCDAALRRAALVGESDRQDTGLYAAVFGVVAQYQGGPKAGACVERAQSMLSRLAAYRPGDAVLKAATSRAIAAREAGSTSPTAAVATARPASSAHHQAASVTKSQGNVTVVPDVALTKKKRQSLKAIKTFSFERGARIVLSMSGPIQYESGLLAPDPASKRGHRLYLDLKRTRIRTKSKVTKTKGLVTQVRLGKQLGGNTRVVLDLAGPVNRRIFYLPSPFRVVIDLEEPGAGGAASPTSAHRAHEKITVRRLALDPGHGGVDAGAVGPTGLREKDVTLDVSHRAASAIAAELGIETMLTRDDDSYIPLEERTARANAFGADLFLSVHCNATENGAASGVEVFVLDPNREASVRVLDAVDRENHGHAKRRRYDRVHVQDHLEQLSSGLAVGDSRARSLHLADLVRKATLASLGQRYPQTTDHGVKKAGFYVLVGARMPAALFEMSFISNPSDEKRLATADYRQKLADAIVNAVRAYRDGVRRR